MTRLFATTALTATVSLLVAGTAPAQTSGPIATYWMTAQTSSGMAAPRGAQKTLLLQLQSSRSADAPSAEHVPPATLNGAPFPLVSPAPNDAPPGRTEPLTEAEMVEMWSKLPKIIVYHGCGETGGAPVEITFANGSSPQMTALWNAVNITMPRSPSPGTGRTYGSWPTGEQREVPANASLAGDHLVRGNYTPDINFSLSGSQDFVGAIQLTGTDPAGGGRLAWNDVANARGYIITTMATNDKGEMVMWSSSDVPIMPGAVPDFLTPADLGGLVSRKIVMPPTKRECAIPAAVQAAASNTMVRMIAFGGDADFSYPPRPANRRQAWNLEHVVKVRSNSTTMAMLGAAQPTAQTNAGMEDTGGAAPSAMPAAPGPMGLPMPSVGGAARAVIGGFLRRR